MTTTIGFDPEFFVAQKGYRTPIPVCGLIGGTKAAPKSLPMDGYFYHEDNVVAELGVPPASDPYEACEVLTTGMNLLNAKLKEKGLRKIYHAEYEFSPEQLNTPQAREFGCDPDYDAYTGGVKPRRGVPDFGAYRFAGGHIHLGGTFNCPAFVVALLCDLALATRGYINDDNLRRREWYGRAGSFRVKDYGIEYRTLDSMWTKYDDVRYSTVQRAYYIADWCTKTSAVDIKRVVDSVNWVVVRDYINSGTPLTPRKPVDIEVKKVRAMGVPV